MIAARTVVNNVVESFWRSLAVAALLVAVVAGTNGVLPPEGLRSVFSLTVARIRTQYAPKEEVAATRLLALTFFTALCPLASAESQGVWRIFPIGNQRLADNATDHAVGVPTIGKCSAPAPR